MKNNQIKRIDGEPGDARDLSRRDRVMQMLGAAKYADRLRSQSESQVIQFFMEVEESHLYIEYGYERFADFLDNCGLSGMSKSSYYRLRDLYLKEGAERYDLLTEWKISLATRKLLTPGDIAFEGDEVIIGDERVKLGEHGKRVKTLIETLVQEKAALRGDLEKSVETVEKQDEKIKTVQASNDEFARILDAQEKGTSYEIAMMAFLKSALVLVGEVKALEHEERSERAHADLHTYAEQWRQLFEAYGVQGVTFENMRTGATSGTWDDIVGD